MTEVANTDVAKTGAFKYEDGTRYVGQWNSKGYKHGMGHLTLPDGTRYDGAMASGLCSGLGVMAFPDGAKEEAIYAIYDVGEPCFGTNGPARPEKYHGLTENRRETALALCFAEYEGEFMQGWFHGHGVFWRADGMKFEGEFRGGRVWGLGLVTFCDGSHGFPKNEGFFQDCRMIRRKKCPDVVQRAQKVAYMARAQCQQM